jgi:hypothetical protein
LPRSRDAGSHGTTGVPLAPPIEMSFATQASIILRFAESPALRRSLIATLFTGGYRNEVEEVTLGRVGLMLLRRLVA